MITLHSPDMDFQQKLLKEQVESTHLKWNRGEYQRYIHVKSEPKIYRGIWLINYMQRLYFTRPYLSWKVNSCKIL
jgi:hypothetical protein